MSWGWFVGLGVVVLALGIRIAVRKGLLSKRGGIGESPENTVRTRYARGEISKEEYERILRDLRR